MHEVILHVGRKNFTFYLTAELILIFYYIFSRLELFFVWMQKSLCVFYLGVVVYHLLLPNKDGDGPFELDSHANKWKKMLKLQLITRADWPTQSPSIWNITKALIVYILYFRSNEQCTILTRACLNIYYPRFTRQKLIPSYPLRPLKDNYI